MGGGGHEEEEEEVVDIGMEELNEWEVEGVLERTTELKTFVVVDVDEEKGREREKGEEEKGEGPYVHWRQPEASVYLTAFRAEMIRGSEPNTFIRPLHRDRRWDTPQRRMKMLWAQKEMK